nr:MAG TPA: hypothetical protein [Bacteriophage sp.]
MIFLQELSLYGLSHFCFRNKSVEGTGVNLL